LYNDESSVGIVNTEYMPAMDSFLRVLKAESADVVCLQEVYAKAGGLKSLSRFLKSEGGYDYSQSYTLSANRPYGMLVLSKYKIKRWQPIAFGPNTGNMAMWVDVEVTDSQYQRGKPRIRIYNLHLQSFRFAKQDYAVMQKQTQQQQLDIGVSAPGGAGEFGEGEHAGLRFPEDCVRGFQRYSGELHVPGAERGDEGRFWRGGSGLGNHLQGEYAQFSD
jgi:hypothetical protein